MVLPVSGREEEDEVGDAGRDALSLHDRCFLSAPYASVADGEEVKGVLGVLDAEPGYALALQGAFLVVVAAFAGVLLRGLPEEVTEDLRRGFLFLWHH